MKITNVGVMARGSWLNYRYFFPHPLLLASSVKQTGYQQWRWLKFYVCIAS